MSAQPAPIPFSKHDAKNARRSYQHIDAIVNRVINRIVQGLSEDEARAFKPSVFATIHSLHGFFNGREVSKKKPLIKAHKFVVSHFDYYAPPVDPNSESDEAARKRASNIARFMDRRLDALAAAEWACGLRLVELARADNETLLWTSYEGHPLLDVAEWVYLQARSKPDYWKNPAAAVSDDLLDAAIAKLPEIDRGRDVATGLMWLFYYCKAEHDDLFQGEEDSERWESADLMAGSIVKGMWTKVISGAERALVKEFDTGGDPEIAAAKAAKKIIDLGKAIKQKLARERLTSAMAMGDDDIGQASTVVNTVFPQESADVATDGGPTLDKNVVGSDGPVLQTKGVTDTENTPVPLQYALEFIKNGLAVLPLWGVSDGICDCRAGSECKPAGKHPHSSLARNGVYAATNNEATVRQWFKKDPRINLGLAMGGPLNLICVDVDPRNDGDATYCDLIEAHGDGAFPETFTQRTGGNGWHRVYRLPDGVAPKKGELKAELGPGVDIKGQGGLIVAAGSMHASGRMYEVETNALIAEAPEWIVNAVVKSLAGEKPDVVVDFQAHRDRRRAGISGAVIVEGERNKRLFKIGCALWGKGEVMSHGHLLSELTDINMEKVSPSLDYSEVEKIAESISSRYALGEPIDDENVA